MGRREVLQWIERAEDKAVGMCSVLLGLEFENCELKAADEGFYLNMNVWQHERDYFSSSFLNRLVAYKLSYK